MSGTEGRPATPKQVLVAHIAERHRTPPGNVTTRESLALWHARQHHRFWTNHYHEGPNTGPGNRPPGWATGADVVDRA